jgi:hypothetical protein
MFIENINVGDTVCTLSMDHLQVINVYRDEDLVELEDGTFHDPAELDVADHTYSHLVDSVLHRA